MDAVVFMDSVKNPPQAAAAPPPPKSEKRSPISANASLIAGVGTLLLALGIGVLIGKTGESGPSSAGGAPSVIRVGGGSETASAESASEAGGGKKGGASASKADGASASKGKAKLETTSSGATQASSEVLKPTGNVKFAPSEVKKGDSCEEGAAGCEGGKFNGSFFE
jgi:hypothetical protein